ncbi:hypothetical protein L202_00992 [Cryptococcus amylolentus CBS 6039]|uniref:Uncharacterized protein n=1 Tax=Cryptococcus amylolentus CBS 6039 TaxID=1295533 RepID=A0A1E3I224_9TREE|nr:hypothetical protein L202_00992 [Cryptococcus amylolentus CBS 6039]ODN82700.1 hypothetical protein L202_00992 [Cryptococcus amylolentus CBS 6039]
MTFAEVLQVTQVIYDYPWSVIVNTALSSIPRRTSSIQREYYGCIKALGLGVIDEEAVSDGVAEYGSENSDPGTKDNDPSWDEWSRLSLDDPTNALIGFAAVIAFPVSYPIDIQSYHTLVYRVDSYDDDGVNHYSSARAVCAEIAESLFLRMYAKKTSTFTV